MLGDSVPHACRFTGARLAPKIPSDKRIPSGLPLIHPESGPNIRGESRAIAKKGTNKQPGETVAPKTPSYGISEMKDSGLSSI
jgi:hypothetical protein